jgi:hypothetical protein
MSELVSERSGTTLTLTLNRPDKTSVNASPQSAAARANSAAPISAASEAEDALELQLADQRVHQRLAVLAAHLREDNLGAVGAVEAAEIGLYLEELLRLLQGHRAECPASFTSTFSSSAA